MSNESVYKYNSWPLGKLPKELQRPEPDLIKEKGYHWEDPRDIIDIFENKIARFAGCKYACLTDCCTNGIFLALKYLQTKGTVRAGDVITIPSRTYVSLPMLLVHAGLKVKFEHIEWSGEYQLKPLSVYDSAVKWTKGMYLGGDAFQVISFQIKKRIPIGRGGAVLTDSKEAYEWIKLASYDGRNLRIPYMDPEHIKAIGWHCYMTPEDAARGILLMDSVPEVNEDSGDYTKYFDCEEVFKRIGL